MVDTVRPVPPTEESVSSENEQSSTTALPRRDPRLTIRYNLPTDASRPLPNHRRTDSISETKSYGEILVESLSDLTSHITSLTTTTQEHERATKAYDIIADRHAKAKNLDQFPAAKALMIQSKDSQAEEVARLDQKLKELRDRSKSMGQSMAAIFNAQPRGQSSSDEKLIAIQTDAKSALSVAESFKGETSEIKNDLQKLKKAHDDVKSNLNKSVSFGGRIKTLEDRLEAASSSSAAHTKDIQEVRARLHERPVAHVATKVVQQQLDGLADDMSEVKQTVQMLSEVQRHNESLMARISDFKESLTRMEEKKLNRVTELAGRLDMMESQLPASSSIAKDTHAALRDLKVRVDDLEKRRPGMSGIDQQALKHEVMKILPTLEIPQMPAATAVVPPASPVNELQAKYEYLDKTFKEFLDIQAFKDDQQMQLIEDLERKLGDKLKSALEMTKVDGDQATQESKQELQEIQSQTVNITNAVERLSAHSDISKGRLQTLETAIVSLESRYNQLTTEPIIRQVMAAVQDIYPTPQTIRGVINGINDINARLPSMPDISKIQTAIESQGSQLSSLHHFREQIRSHDQLVPEIQRLSQSLQQRETEMNGLAEDLRVLQDEIQQIRSTTQNFQVHEAERGFVQELSAKVHEMDGTQDHLQVELKSVLGKIDSLRPSRLEGIESQIQGIQETVENKTRELSDKIDVIQQTSHAEIEDLLKALDDSRQLGVEESKELHQKVEDLKDIFQNEIHDTLERLRDLEQARSSLEAHFTSESSSDAKPVPQPYVTFESSLSQPGSGTTVDRVAELARRTLEHNNRKRKRQSSHRSDDHVEDLSSSNSNPSTPSLDEASSQARQVKRPHRKDHDSAKSAE